MEIWRTIKAYPNYEVSNLGRVKNKVRNRIMKLFDRKSNGYLSVLLPNKATKKDDNHSAHSLVMGAFVGVRPDGLVINHINGIKWDNRLENLEYCTQSHNRKEDFIHGRQSYRGEKNNSAKLTEDQVMEIIKLYKSGGYTC